MKRLLVLCGKDCGYCKKAKMMIRRALEKEPKYTVLDIRFLYDNEPEAIRYRHKFVPAFFCGNVLFFEGNPDMNVITAALKNCYNN